MSVALVYENQDLIEYLVLGGNEDTTTPICTIGKMGYESVPVIACGMVHNYVKNGTMGLSAATLLAGMKFHRDVEDNKPPSFNGYPVGYVEYHSIVYGLRVSYENIRLMHHQKVDITAVIAYRHYLYNLSTESDDGKLYFVASTGTDDTPIRDVEGWHIVNMIPSGGYGEAICIGGKTNDLRFCAGSANNLYRCTMLQAAMSQPVHSKLTMRDPRCEYATFTGHSDAVSMVNVDNTLICEQDGMITIYDERANAMIGTPFTADGYIGACRTR